ncbi:type II secretion system F family protein [Candidatus Sulfurimonas baltica]|uniref:Type II secretion system F family protein n=1 Tax=Candidatus Sulfurimonas baltica TaxID=2740404 RepID=A0A7S7LX34_9BACT|nr:type II secretion system F family protein [Candidatus Sulfurimonas baltica]QOY53056.1 type II secretion system F family protein [Candidatus Sulfurimonas baltica]
MYYFIQGLNTKGQRSINFAEAKDYKQLVSRLEKQGVLPLNIIELPSFLSFIVPSSGKKILQEEVIELIDNMYLVIKSGLPLHQGIVDLAEDSENARFKNMLLQIADEINAGKSLSEAFKSYEKVIGKMLLNLIRIGEETGQLETTLKRGAAFLKKTMALKKKAKSALIYPSFAFFAVFGAMLVWMIYVVPQMTELFTEMGIKLPPLTLLIMATSDFFTDYISYMVISLVVFIILFKILHAKYKIIRWHTDKLLLKVPVIKHIISGFNIAFIAEYLRLAIVSGVPMYTALEILKETTNNELYKKALIDATADVAGGNQLSEALKKTKLFTPFMLRMISVGESSGSLDTQLELISEFYYSKVDYYAENIGKVIEPVVLIFVGSFMALIMVGLMGPMYDLIGQIDQ